MKVNDLYILHYTIALFGDLAKLDLKIIENNCEQLYQIFIPLIDLKVKKHENPSEKLSVCNNTVWTIGLLALFYPAKTNYYIEPVMRQFEEILKLSKVSFKM